MNPAIFYQGDAYHTGGSRLLGRQAAGEGFLKALIRHGTQEALYCYAPSRSAFQQLQTQIQPWLGRSLQTYWIDVNSPQELAEPGLLFRPDSVISGHVWERRWVSETAYSICGITHSIASKPAMEDLGQLLLAPVQPWDALICPSEAVKKVVEQLWANWRDYLHDRTGGWLTPQIQLPVIPLGVDCAAFPVGDQAQAVRRSLHQKWGIPEDSLTALYMGRLSFATKAHPVPMCIALERAAQATGKKLNLILAGWFDSEAESRGFQESVQAFCPSVNALCVDGRSSEVRQGVWAAADWFMSLADNIQETFGLTPIEAMAAGLPVIVSDWDGYQYSVRDRVDGFRIPTVLPPPGSGSNLALGQLNQSLAYGEYAGYSALLTSVDITACTQALIELIQNSELRQQMGNSGRQRAETLYDWSIVMKSYEALWQELADRRQAEPMRDQPSLYPLCDDPTQLFQHYATQTLSHEQHLTLGETDFKLIQQVGITQVGSDRRLPIPIIEDLLKTIATQGSVSVRSLIEQYGKEGGSNSPSVRLRQRAWQTLSYLLKFDVVRLG